MVVERTQPAAGPDLSVPVRFGARVRAARARQGLTLDDLAAAAGSAGPRSPIWSGASTVPR